MFKKYVLGITAAMLLSAPAVAQTLNSTSNSSSNAGANSSSTSGASNLGNTQNINFNSPGQTSATNTDNVRYSGGTNNYSRNDGDLTIRTTPQVYAPPVSGGNPCTLAVSGGVSVIGWGAAAGGTFVDQDCANRQKIAMIWNAGFKVPAKELMCNDRDTYIAFRTAGEPCAFRQAFEPANTLPPAPPARPAPLSQPAPQPGGMSIPAPVAATKVYPRCNARLGIVDNCQS